MKKLFLTLGVIGLIGFTACKKTKEKVDDTVEATEQAAENAGDAVVDGAETVGETVGETAENVGETAENVAEDAQSIVEGVPDFESEELQTLANDYKAFYDEMIAAATSGDATKLAELTQKSQEWSTKAQEVVGKVSAEDAEKWTKFASELAQKASGQ